MWVDSHLHLWDTNHISYPWLEDVSELPRQVPLAGTPVPEEIDAVVVVQADAAPRHSLAEVDWIVSQAATTTAPKLGGIVAWAPLDDEQTLGQHLSELQNRPAIVGVRQLFQDWRQGRVSSGVVDQGVRQLAASDLSLDVCVRWWQLPEVTELLIRSPELPVVLDHCGKPPLGDEASMRRWRSDLAQLARLEHVHVKLSGLYPELDATQPAKPQIADALGFALEVFGIERSMFGSDWPVSEAFDQTTPADSVPAYLRWLDAIRELTDESDAVMGGTAKRFYRLPEDTQALE